MNLEIMAFTNKFLYFLFFISLAVKPIRSLSQAGGLDTSFNGDGVVTTALGPIWDNGRAMAIQLDGKIVVSGESLDATSKYNFATARYTSSGILDTTFNGTGKVTTAISMFNDRGYAVSMQSNNKLVVAGYSTDGVLENIGLVRYNSNGSLNSSFDADGIVSTSIGVSSRALAVAIQGDGKIIIAGYTGTGNYLDILVIRYNSNGSLDTTFDTDGIVTTSISNTSDIGYSIALLNGGKIIVSGGSLFGFDMDFALVRYNNNGSLDSTFGINGIVTTDFGTGYDRGHAMAIQLDGKILVAGVSKDSISSKFAISRYHHHGGLDTSFGNGGIVTTTFGGTTNFAYSIALQANGKIVVAGTCQFAIPSGFALARYNNDGSLDTNFNGTGKVVTDVDATNSVNAVALQYDGRIVAAGVSFYSGYSQFSVARYLGDEVVNIENVNDQSTLLTLFPNPCTDILNIHTQRVMNNATLEIYDINGELYRRYEHLNGFSYSINLQNSSRKYFLIRLTQENKTIAIRRLLMKE